MTSPTRLYSIVATTGAVIMALEIISSRILAPHFGNSVYVWGSIISVFLAALSLGYFLGGRLADRQPDLAVLGQLILAATIWQAGLLFGGRELAGALGRLTGGSPAGTLLATTALFGPPSVFLATVSPYAIRLATRDLAHLGNTAGRLFALSTFGSLFGTLASTFLLIPFLELHRILSLLVFVSAVAALLAWRRGARGGAVRLTAAAMLLATAVGVGFSSPRPTGSTLYTRMTPYQTLEITESDSVRYLKSDRVMQSAIHMESRLPELYYLKHASGTLLLAPEMKSMLVLGMGGGVVGGYLRRQLGELEVDYVDIDPAIPDLARDWLFFEDGPQDRVHIADGRRFLAASDARWDIIYCDTYIGLSVPFHLTTAEFLYEAKQHLTESGIFASNLASGLDDPFVRAILRTAKEVFGTVYVFGVRGSRNILVVATPEVETLSTERLIEIGRELDTRYTFEPPLAEIASRRLEVTIDPAVDQILTDAFAPANHLIRLGQKRLPAAAPR